MTRSGLVVGESEGSQWSLPAYGGDQRHSQRTQGCCSSDVWLEVVKDFWFGVDDEGWLTLNGNISSNRSKRGGVTGQGVGEQQVLSSASLHSTSGNTRRES